MKRRGSSELKETREDLPDDLVEYAFIRFLYEKRDDIYQLLPVSKKMARFQDMQSQALLGQKPFI